MINKPKYIQIKDCILKDIKNHTLHAGDQIPTESELCERFQVSRMTVNKAISALTTEGYIRRIAGKGSFVTSSLVQKQFHYQPNSFTEDMESIGLKPGARLLEYRIYRGADISPEIAQKLGAEPDDLIHYFSRIRTGNGMIISISYNYVPCKTIPAIDIACLENSFFKYVKKLGFSDLHTIDFSLSAALPTPEQKKLLEIENEALLKVSHITCSGQDTIIEYIDTYYIGSMYTYRLD
ncbi:GntR family transcriptional regulator [Clostridium sp. Marseille-P2415]|uniref:GntR family transcriptional regulator n=1 Tax=Clostridium sp. Marseille-P2415 TaxID=1805471 RepID=UPI0009888BDA|nr:GntR family transcriptional regulator [Clostridium sp. Marseille-P2415]